MEDGAIVKPGLTESCADACCPSTPSALSLTSERTALIWHAFRLEWMTVAWMVVEGVVALAAGLAAGSLTLMAFGLDSAIELASAGVLIWRLNVELRHGQGFSERAERTATRIGAVLLFTLAAYIVTGAAWSLWTRHGEAFSLPGLIVVLLAMPIMTLLARRKIAIATQLGSRAMRADAAESITCGWLSFVVVVGLLADLMLGAWWVDAVTSLVIVGFVVKELRRPRGKGQLTPRKIGARHPHKTNEAGRQGRARTKTEKAFEEERPSSARVLAGGLERRRAEDRVRRARSDLEDRRIRRGGCVGLFNGFVPGHGQLQEWFPHKPCAHSLNSPLTKAGPKLRLRLDPSQRYDGASDLSYAEPSCDNLGESGETG
jgi:hypothetical protein